MMHTYFLAAWLGTHRARDERGANMVEYVLLLAFIAVVVIVAVAWLGGIVDEGFRSGGSEFDGAR